MACFEGLCLFRLYAGSDISLAPPFTNPPNTAPDEDVLSPGIESSNSRYSKSMLTKLSQKTMKHYF